MNKNSILKAARAKDIPEGLSGLWLIKKKYLKKPVFTVHRGRFAEFLPKGIYTHLIKATVEKMHLVIPGDVVMEDTPFELKTHLHFMLHAFGDVLVTGLGLGCVIRGLFANKNVHSVTCIERSADVLKLVGPYMGQDHLEIIQADAVEWCNQNKRIFDCAYHDLWRDPDNQSDEYLDLSHARMMLALRDKVKNQGAWNIVRWLPKAMRMKKRKGLYNFDAT